MLIQTKLTPFNIYFPNNVTTMSWFTTPPVVGLNQETLLFGLIGETKSSSHKISSSSNSNVKLITIKNIIQKTWLLSHWSNVALRVIGVGFKVRLRASRLSLELGRSHRIFIGVPLGIYIGLTYPIKKNMFLLKSSQISLLGTFVQKIQLLRQPDIYRNKGIQIRHTQYRFRPGKKKSH